MQVKVDLGFDELLKIVKDLPVGKLRQLLAEIEGKVNENKPNNDLEQLLLNGPTATKEQLEAIANNRKKINQNIIENNISSRFGLTK